MRIVFTAKGSDWDSEMDPRFGRAPFFLIYDEDTDKMEAIDNSEIANMAHGAGPKAAENIFSIKPDVLITGNGPGGNAARVFEKTDISIFVGAGHLKANEAYNAYKNNELEKM